jgi:hypothetical protein
LLVAGCCLAGCGGDSLGDDARQADSLRAAARLLAVDAAQGKLTAPYTRAQSEEYAAAAEELRSRIGSDPGDQRERSRAVAAADSTARGMRSLALRPADRATASSVAESLKPGAS